MVWSSNYDKDDNRPLTIGINKKVLGLWMMVKKLKIIKKLKEQRSM